MLTGVTKFGHLNVFSGLNNINDISFVAKYSAICGITEKQLIDTFAESISTFASNYGCDFDIMVDKLRALYDGYRFTPAPVLVYNPFSILMAMDHLELDSFWFQTGMPKYLVDLLKADHYVLSNLEGSCADKSTLSSFNPDDTNPIPVIYQSGYLTIKDYDRDENEFTLGFPNN